MATEAKEDGAPFPLRALAFAEVIGHRATVALLQRLHRVGRLSHALLIDGPQGCGRRTLALALARALLCTQPTSDGDSCGQCQSCQAIAAGVHPDLQILPDDRAAPQVPVETIREEIVTAATESALWGHGRVFIIPAVERLRQEGANALLKVLEEPPPSTSIIMTSKLGDGLLATIRSRSQRFRVHGLGSNELTQVLMGLGVARHEAERQAKQAGASLRSGGAPGLQPPLAGLQDIIGAGFEAEALADLYAQLDEQSAVVGGNTPAARQRACLRMWLDAAIESQRRQLAGTDPQGAMRMIDALIQARSDVAVNINPRLVLEGLALAQ